MKRLLTLIALFTLLYPAVSFSQITLSQYALGFTNPVDIKNCGDDRLFIVEQAGYIRIVDTNGVIKPQPFLDIHTHLLSGGERGLLGLAFDPHYQTNGFFYVYYTELSHGDVVVSRFSVSASNPDSAVVSSEDTVIRIWHPYSNHNGGHIAFRHSDGYLYMGTGDGGSGGDPGNRAQNKDSLLGKILRLDVSDTSVAYKIPPDNPLVGTTGRGEIWNIGQRNPWRWSFDRKTDDLWIGDVGQNAWEEVDYQPLSKRGGNYGWRCYEGNGHPYNTAGCQAASFYDAPIFDYANNGAAVVGGYRYRGAKYANMYGKYFCTDEFTTTYQFRTIEPNGSGGWTATQIGTLGRTTVVAFGEDRWGELYCADYNNGGIYKFVGATCAPVASISDNDTIYLCDTTVAKALTTPNGNGFHYEWFLNGASIANSDNDTLLTTQTGAYNVTVTDPNSCTATSDTVYLVYTIPPTVSIANLDTFYCVYHDPDTLIGSPAGGVFTGPGLGGAQNNIFDPVFAGIGDHFITYTYNDALTGCSYSSTLPVHVDFCTSTPENSVQRFRIYPNPGTGLFTLDFYTSNNHPVNVEVYDVTGRMVYSENLHSEKGIQSSKIDLSHLTKGIYNVKLIFEDDIATRRVVLE